MAARVWAALAAALVIYGALLFGSAGTLRWVAGWAYLAIFFASAVLIVVLLARHDPALLAERLKSPVQRAQPLWDKIFLIALQFAWCGWLGLMGLDSVRFRWSEMPACLAWIGAAGLIASFWFMYRTLRENTFLAPVVISTGPYAMVRHPYYAGALLMFVSTALLLAPGMAWRPRRS